MVVLLYPDISNFTFQNVKILKCKIFLINFLDELGNFKQKKFYTSKCNFFLHFKATEPYLKKVIENSVFSFETMPKNSKMPAKELDIIIFILNLSQL